MAYRKLPPKMDENMKPQGPPKMAESNNPQGPVRRVTRSQSLSKYATAQQIQPQQPVVYINGRIRSITPLALLRPDNSFKPTVMGPPPAPHKPDWLSSWIQSSGALLTISGQGAHVSMSELRDMPATAAAAIMSTHYHSTTLSSPGKKYHFERGMLGRLRYDNDLSLHISKHNSTVATLARPSPRGKQLNVLRKLPEDVRNHIYLEIFSAQRKDPIYSLGAINLIEVHDRVYREIFVQRQDPISSVAAFNPITSSSLALVIPPASNYPAQTARRDFTAFLRAIADDKLIFEELLLFRFIESQKMRHVLLKQIEQGFWDWHPTRQPNYPLLDLVTCGMHVM